MPYNVSIRERIVRQWATNLGAITEVDVGTVHRFDTRLTATYQPTDIIISQDSGEYLTDATIGNMGTLDQTMELRVIAYVPAPVDDSESTAKYTNRYLAAIEDCLLSDRFTTETTGGAKLTYDVKLVNSEFDEFDGGVVFCAVTARMYLSLIHI